MYLSIINVEPQDKFRLLLTFENEEKRVFDMSPYLEIGIFQELKKGSMFKTVKVSFDSIEWANHADLDPELLYKKSQPLG